MTKETNFRGNFREKVFIEVILLILLNYHDCFLEFTF